MSTISIIMATYNGEKYLREQIDSILDNTYTDWNMEICDDGSKDNTLVIAKEYEDKYPDKIQVYQNVKNLGLVQNFLEGAKRARGQYVMFCDQDDVWLPFKLGDTLNYLYKMEAKYGKDIPISVFSDARVVDSNLLELHSSFYKASHLDIRKLDLPHILMENKMIGCTVMFNRRTLDFLETLPKSARYHDWWIAIIASCFGEIGYLDRGTLLYRQHEKNVVGNQSFFAYVKNRLSSLKKQKEVLRETQRQAFDFYEIFKASIPEREKLVVNEFANLEKANWFVRRFTVIRYGFLKTGMIRNIGLLLII